MLERFMEALSCIDQCFIGDEMLERLPLPSRVGKSLVGGIDLNKRRLRHVTEAIVALSASPDGFTASVLADQVRALGNQSLSAYGPRQAAYDLKKLRGKQIVRRIGSTRRYEPLPSGLRAITALLVLRNKAIKPLLAAAQLDFIESAASPSRLDVKDCFLPEDFVGSFKREPEASEVSERAPASPHVGPVEQLEAV